MVATVTLYKTPDGQTFASEHEAEAHEAVLKHEAEIEAFLDKHYPRPKEGKPGPTRAIAKKAIVAWVASQA